MIPWYMCLLLKKAQNKLMTQNCYPARSWWSELCLNWDVETYRVQLSRCWLSHHIGLSWQRPCDVPQSYKPSSVIYLSVYGLLGVSFEERPLRACQRKQVLQELFQLCQQSTTSIIYILMAHKSLYPTKISLMSIRDIYPTSSRTSLWWHHRYFKLNMLRNEPIIIRKKDKTLLFSLISLADQCRAYESSWRPPLFFCSLSNQIPSLINLSS